MADLIKLEYFFKYLESNDYVDLITSVVEFLLNDLGKGDGEKIVEVVSHMVSEEVGGKMISLAEKMKRKARNEGVVLGMQQGMQQGMHIVAKRLLTEGMSEVLIIKVTGLSSDEIKHLKKELCETQH